VRAVLPRLSRPVSVPARCEYARSRHGLVVLPRTIEQYARAAERPFDAIVLNAVLEHVYDPDSMIASCAGLTRPGAVVYIDVPREPNLMTIVGSRAANWTGTASNMFV